MSASSLCCDIIEREVVDGQRALTVARLAALAHCAHDEAAAALAAALADSQNGGNGDKKPRLHAVYFVCGGGDGGTGVTVRLVPASRAQEARAAVATPLRACHVYAVAPKPIDNVSVLYDERAVPAAPRRPAADDDAAAPVRSGPERDGGQTGRGDEAAGASSAHPPLAPPTKGTESKVDDVAAPADTKKADTAGASKQRDTNETKTTDYNSSCVDIFTTGDDEDDWGAERAQPQATPPTEERTAAVAKRGGAKRKRPATAEPDAAPADGRENADVAPADGDCAEPAAGKSGRSESGAGVHMRAAAATFVDTDGFLVTRKVSEPVAKTEPVGESDKLRPTQADKRRPAAATKAAKKAPPKQQASLTAFFKKQ